MAFLEKIPSWLRWILFLPLAGIAHFLVKVIIFMLPPKVLYGGSNLRHIFLWALVAGPAAFVLVWVGAKVAPRAQFKISINLAVVYGLFYSLVLGGSYLEPTSTTLRTEIIVDLGIGLIGAVAACYLFYRNYKKGKPQDTEYEVIEVHEEKNRSEENNDLTVETPWEAVAPSEEEEPEDNLTSELSKVGFIGRFEDTFFYLIPKWFKDAKSTSEKVGIALVFITLIFLMIVICLATGYYK
ncbi:MAG: hypothetical protein PVI73_08855 [Syntrophobacterales bacterium]|jgi:hypothetical protein